MPANSTMGISEGGSVAYLHHFQNQIIKEEFSSQSSQESQTGTYQSVPTEESNYQPFSAYSHEPPSGVGENESQA